MLAVFRRYGLVLPALALLTVAGAYLRLRQAWESVYDVVVHSVPDDSFYYFQIARNIMHGRGATLDGETVTNGFHPLWLVVQLPVFAIDDRDLSLHLALSLGALIGTATIPLVFEIVRRLVDNARAALLAAAVFAVHPVIVTYGVNGLETSLSMLTLASLILVFVLMMQRVVPLRTRDYVVLGCLGALAVLARTDTALVLVFMSGALALRERGSLRWRGSLVTGASAAALVVPWLLWSLIATGHVTQDSAVAGGHVFRELYFDRNESEFWSNVSRGLELTRYAVLKELPAQFAVPFGTSAVPYWLGLLALGFFVAAVPTSRRSATLRASVTLAVPFLALLTMLVLEAGVRWFTRRWYFAPFSLGMALYIGLALNYFEGVIDDALAWFRDRGNRRNVLPAAVLYAGLYFLAAGVLARQFAPSRFDGLNYWYPWQPDGLESAVWLNEHTAPESRIAAYNTGIPSYFANRTVVNLDGVVNRDAFEALRDCDTRSYIRDMRIDYVVDSEPQFRITSCALDLDRDLTIEASAGNVVPILITRPRPD